MPNYKEDALWHSEGVIEIAAGESLDIELPSIIKTAASSLMFVQRVLDNDASAYRFVASSFINVEVSYLGTTFENDNFMVLFNRDREVEDGYFENTAELYLRGADIATITLSLQNQSEYTLTLSSLYLYESDDIQITTIAKVLKEETIQADLIQATSVFTDSIFTQILQTNAWSRSARLAHVGDHVDYIQAEGMEIGFYSAVLGEEQEQFSITVEKAGSQTTYNYWYASISGEDAYKYLTTIDPRDKWPDITDANRDAFKFMVYKPSALVKKLSIEFAYDENNALTPSIIYGAGDASGKMKGYTYKNSNGFYHIYEQSDGDLVGIVMDEQGVHITGWADQHAESIKFYNNGVKLKFTGEEEHRFEYVIENNTLMGIIEDDNYLTSITYHDEDL